MQYTSFFFLLFLLVVTAVYFLFPLKVRWVVLFVASLVFYGMAGKEFLPWLLADALISYAAARQIDARDKKTEKKARWTILSVVLVVIIGFLCLVKFAKYLPFVGSIVMPIGISYYTFAAIGYILDVYWGRYAAEKNFLKYLLFISFFPHILQGPIARYNRLGPQLAEGHRFDYTRLCYGAQLMVWGFFQKLVIADRLDMFVSRVFADYENAYGLVVVLAVFFYAIELYTDFSGCVNIARGMSQILGIELEENFRQPYFSQSVEEFWRRWHITLGNWFRDYLGMPVSMSKPVKKWSKAARKKWGAEAGRRVVTISALVVVWLCTGLWHGTGWNYMIWACWQGGIIILGVLWKERYGRWREKLYIREESKGFQLFRMVRTFILAGMIPRLVTRAPSLHAALTMFGNLFRGSGLGQLTGDNLAALGWSRVNLLIALLGICIQLGVSILKEREVSIRQTVAGWILPVRWLIYLTAFFSVVIFGIYGPGYDPRAFAYMGF